VGGRDIKPGINVYRFANRIPLLFEVPVLQHSAVALEPCMNIPLIAQRMCMDAASLSIHTRYALHEHTRLHSHLVVFSGRL
jgi:hypothetical protein